MPRVRITTLGCKVNQFESAAFKTGFLKHGFSIARRGEQADLIVINSCAVTGAAGAQSRQTLRKTLRNNPEAAAIFTGCFAELGAAELQQEAELENRRYMIIGNSCKDRVVEAGLLLLAGTDITCPDQWLGDISQAKEICRLEVGRFEERSRAYLRIQDGCENFCSYCIVPYTRGPSRSLPPDEVIHQAQLFADAGHRELVLTGIHIGRYGLDFTPPGSMAELLTRLVEALPELRFRISSLEPMEISETILTLLKTQPSIQPHLHIPLQSGDDEILAAMNRRYTTAEFRQVVERCRASQPDMAIGIDILVGFPGESDAHFQRAVEFLEQLDFTYLHVFPYSKRPGTVAAAMKNHVDKKTKEARVAVLRKLSAQKQQRFHQSQCNRELEVLVEGRRTSDGLLRGISGNYVPVHFAGPDDLLGGITRVRLLHCQDDHVFGERLSQYED